MSTTPANERGDGACVCGPAGGWSPPPLDPSSASPLSPCAATWSGGLRALAVAPPPLADAATARALGGRSGGGCVSIVLARDPIPRLSGRSVGALLHEAMALGTLGGVSLGGGGGGGDSDAFPAGGSHRGSGDDARKGRAEGGSSSALRRTASAASLARAASGAWRAAFRGGEGEDGDPRRSGESGDAWAPAPPAAPVAETGSNPPPDRDATLTAALYPPGRVYRLSTATAARGEAAHLSGGGARARARAALRRAAAVAGHGGGGRGGGLPARRRSGAEASRDEGHRPSSSGTTVEGGWGGWWGSGGGGGWVEKSSTAGAAGVTGSGSDSGGWCEAADSGYASSDEKDDDEGRGARGPPPPPPVGGGGGGLLLPGPGSPGSPGAVTVRRRSLSSPPRSTPPPAGSLPRGTLPQPYPEATPLDLPPDPALPSGAPVPLCLARGPPSPAPPAPSAPAVDDISRFPHCRRAERLLLSSTSVRDHLPDRYAAALLALADLAAAAERGAGG